MKRFTQKKQIKKSIVAVLAIVLTIGLAACGGSGTAEVEPPLDGDGYDNPNGPAANAHINIVTTIFPEYDWARQVAQDVEGVNIDMLIDNGVDLHSFQPTADDIINISTCDMFIYVGGESDKWVDDALKEAVNKDMVVIDLMDILGESVKEEEVVEGMEAEEEEEEEGEEEVEYDEHVWLSLKNAETCVNYISEKLQEIDAENAEAYKVNTERYINSLEDLNNQYIDTVNNSPYDTLIFGDRFPFRYMVDDYGLNYYAAFVGCSAETEASFDTIIFLADKVDETGVPAICIIEGSDGKIADTIKENTDSGDQEILAFNSLQAITQSDVDAGVTYLSEMESNLEVLKQALGK